MKKIIDFIKRLFGLSSSKPVEQINVVEPKEIASQPFSEISLVKVHLMKNKKISKAEAKSLYGVTSLNKIVYKLRKRGNKISFDKNTKTYTYEPKA
jgi:hypothetical protein